MHGAVGSTFLSMASMVCVNCSLLPLASIGIVAQDISSTTLGGSRSCECERVTGCIQETMWKARWFNLHTTLHYVSPERVTEPGASISSEVRELCSVLGAFLSSELSIL